MSGAQEGYSWRLNIGSIQVNMPSITTATPKMFTPSPALTMSMTFRWPYENTIALGGFATGRRNANEVQSVDGSKM